MSGFDRRKSETHPKVVCIVFTCYKGITLHSTISIRYTDTITIVHMEIRRVVFTCYMYLPLHSTTAMDYKITIPTTTLRFHRNTEIQNI